ncbi:MAG: sensor histidine kinase, partial [Pseudomonadales bacterium]|nr:sensor histidine kinase [Pseudomonadales bacterium]
HEQLLQTKEMNHVAMADYVDVLATNLYRRLAPSNIQLELIKELSPVKLSMDQAVPAGLILNELVTNALVHAFKEKTHGSGKLKVSFYELAGDCVILISDDGLGLSHSFQAESDSGVGFEIVSILTQQLDGSFKRVGGIGTTFEVRFPIVSST